MIDKKYRSKKYFFATLLLTLFTSFKLFAQDSISQNVGMADGMRASGKIYVVVAVILIIFTGIVIYLINLDKKISEIEKELKGKNDK